jgi:hypothetical protein
MSGEYLRKSGTDSNRILGTFAAAGGWADGDATATNAVNRRTAAIGCFMGPDRIAFSVEVVQR